uniref:Uncharacterized protein n=1 Tax=Suricata suricatta TaxID=37032 RepID=A0A673VGZ4_SURSU
MNCIPFKTGKPKKQIVPTTVERNFEREYGKLQHLEEQSKRLQKDMKKRERSLYFCPKCLLAWDQMKASRFQRAWALPAI